MLDGSMDCRVKSGNDDGRNVARMSVAKCGVMVGESDPGYRCAHPGYARSTHLTGYGLTAGSAGANPTHRQTNAGSCAVSKRQTGRLTRPTDFCSPQPSIKLQHRIEQNLRARRAFVE